MSKHYLVSFKGQDFVVSFYGIAVEIQPMKGAELHLTMDDILAILSPFKSDVKEAMSDIGLFEIISETSEEEMVFRYKRGYETERGTYLEDPKIPACVLSMEMYCGKWCCAQDRIYLEVQHLMAIAHSYFSTSALFEMHNIYFKKLEPVMGISDGYALSSAIAEYVKSLL